jgi:hypothetical protein
VQNACNLIPLRSRVFYVGRVAVLVELRKEVRSLLSDVVAIHATPRYLIERSEGILCSPRYRLTQTSDDSGVHARRLPLRYIPLLNVIWVQLVAVVRRDAEDREVRGELDRRAVIGERWHAHGRESFDVGSIHLHEVIWLPGLVVEFGARPLEPKGYEAGPPS